VEIQETTPAMVGKPDTRPASGTLGKMAKGEVGHETVKV